jgi:hypothetical protein
MMKPFDPDHWGRSMFFAALLGVFIAYWAVTCITWQVDNEYPALHPHRTLAQFVAQQWAGVWHEIRYDLW